MGAEALPTASMSAHDMINGATESNHIDLTMEDESQPQRQRIQLPILRQQPTFGQPSMFAPQMNPSIYRPAFAEPPNNSPFYSGPSRKSIIDLTGSPSPPLQQSQRPQPHNDQHSSTINSQHPHRAHPAPQPSYHTQQALRTPLPESLPPKTPVCIGQLSVTALVIYPVPFLEPNPLDGEWASVRLQYEHNQRGSGQTIHIRPPNTKSPSGEQITHENFGMIEQKVATVLGPMLGKGLIRLDAKVKKLGASIPMLPLQVLVYTPKGNIPIVGNYLYQHRLYLDDPTPPYDAQRLSNYHYSNPHSPPPGGHNPAFMAPTRLYGPQGNSYGRWTTPATSGKSVEVQRSQVDELFKSLKDGDELLETEPTFEIASSLYPHQKKALTFLLEREREKKSSDGTYSSLWQYRPDPVTRQPTWFHLVTQKEIYQAPVEAKGSILADDMGLGKTITCVSLIAATLSSAAAFAATPVDTTATPTQPTQDTLTAGHFSGSVFGMPDVSENNRSNGKGKGKASEKSSGKMEADALRASRIKAKSRATLILCPLSTVSNWEDQFREHWRGEVTVVGGGGGPCTPAPVASVKDVNANGQGSMSGMTLAQPSMFADIKPVEKEKPRVREGTALRVYVYHGNARRPDPAFLADFDAVITTYATLASEFSKQNKSIATPDAEEEDNDSSDGGAVETDERGNQVIRLPKPKRAGTKRKKGSGTSATETPSPLQSIHWFRVVLDEAHSIKETGTVGSRASCDLMADRRLCLSGTPVQNKLDDVFALIKFLRLEPFDDKNIWTEFIGTPVKFGQPIGVARLQTIMKVITLRRTKESKSQDGKRILALPPRRDEVRYLKFDEQEQEVYDHFFLESKAEFNEMTNKNEVMKNYVGILQKILRLRQICDHFELVRGKGLGDEPQDPAQSYEEIAASIAKEGITVSRATAIFALLRESATTQCVECGSELCTSGDTAQADSMDVEPPPTKKAKKTKSGTGSRGSTRASSPAMPHPVLTRCQHLFCITCYRNCICPGWPNVAADMRRSCSACSTGLFPADAVEINPDSTIPDTGKKKTTKREKRQKGILMENFHPSTKIKALIGDLIQFSKTNPHSANFDQESADIQMTDDKGNDIDEGVTKTVVFSQWTSMLDKIEDALEIAGIRYDRLDGTMKREDRTRAMDALKKDPGCEVLLVSLKAGGVGLNLTAAQRVYLMDPYWNPAVENQAVDRIHRLGQTRPVTTVKLIIEKSIEARLLEVQRKKTELANMTLGQNFSKAEMLSRRMEELAQLFN